LPPGTTNDDYFREQCAAAGWPFTSGINCPTAGLIGCCGDFVQYGGAWDCYYDPAAAAAAATNCTTWQETLP